MFLPFLYFLFLFTTAQNQDGNEPDCSTAEVVVLSVLLVVVVISTLLFLIVLYRRRQIGLFGKYSMLWYLFVFCFYYNIIIGVVVACILWMHMWKQNSKRRTSIIIIRLYGTTIFYTIFLNYINNNFINTCIITVHLNQDIHNNFSIFCNKIKYFYNCLIKGFSIRNWIYFYPFFIWRNGN